MDAPASPPASGPVLLPFPPGCVRGRLVRREKRFRVLLDTENGPLWVHTNNSGSMMGLLEPGNEILASPASNSRRQTGHTLELIRAQGVWVGVNTLTPNRLLAAAWEAGLLPWASNFQTLRREAATGSSRLDAVLDNPDGSRLWVEAKNVTLAQDGTALFPDAPTERGRRHLEECMRLVAQGHRAACLFVAQRSDVERFAPARSIDPAYAELFRRAVEAGVEARPHLAVVTPLGIGLGRPLPLEDMS